MNYSFTLEGERILRHINLNNGKTYTSPVIVSDFQNLSTQVTDADYYQRWLQSTEKPYGDISRGEIRVIDLFCGCGGLTLGISEACRALGYKFSSVLGADLSPAALELYKRNFAPLHTISEPIEYIIDSQINAELSKSEREFVKTVGVIDVLIGGPPCQGNSDLNNHTRRSDTRNLLYLRMIRCAEIVRPKFILIENVPGVQHDKHNVVKVAEQELKALGYQVDLGMIDVSKIGVPQKRKRFFLIASKDKEVSLDRAIRQHLSQGNNVGWAIADLLNSESDDVFNSPAHSSATNLKRIDFLFEQDIYDLPNSQRPDCHRLKKHSYTSVYGRMHWEDPAPTITGGFGSNGQGRFVHPKKRRTLTPHEAARLQFFPDYFDFDGVKRRELQQIIGNAVPSKASYVVGVEFISKLEES